MEGGESACLERVVIVFRSFTRHHSSQTIPISLEGVCVCTLENGGMAPGGTVCIL